MKSIQRLTLLALLLVAAPLSAASFTDSTGTFKLEHPDNLRIWEERAPNWRRLVFDGSSKAAPYRFVVTISRRKLSPRRWQRRLKSWAKQTGRTAPRTRQGSIKLLGKQTTTTTLMLPSFGVALASVPFKGVHLNIRCVGDAKQWTAVVNSCAAMARSLKRHNGPVDSGLDGQVKQLRLEVDRTPPLYMLWRGFRPFPNHFTVVHIRNPTDTGVTFERGWVRSLTKPGLMIAIRSFGVPPLWKSGWIYGADGLAVQTGSATIPPRGGALFLLQSALASQTNLRKLKLQFVLKGKDGGRQILNRILQPKKPRTPRFAFPFGAQVRIMRGPKMFVSRRPRWVSFSATGRLISGDPVFWQVAATGKRVVALNTGKVIGISPGPYPELAIRGRRGTVVYRGLDPTTLRVKTGQDITRGDLLGRTFRFAGKTTGQRSLFPWFRVLYFRNLPYTSSPMPHTFSRLLVQRGNRWRGHTLSLKQGEQVRPGAERKRRRKKKRKKKSPPKTAKKP